MTGDLPRPLADYPVLPGASLWHTLVGRAEIEPFNAIATGIFFLAILHTFSAPRFTALAHRVQHRHDAKRPARTALPTPSVVAELLHFLGEVEVVFGLWAVVLLVAMTAYAGWETATHYLERHRQLHRATVRRGHHGAGLDATGGRVRRSGLRRVANIGGGTPAAWWITILTVGPLLGSFITEPAAMTICALLLARQFYDLEPSRRLKYATLGVAVRERLDRRHADALRRAAGADGGAPVGLGHAVHAGAFRLARGARDRRCPRLSITRSSERSRSAGGAARRSPTSNNLTKRRRALSCCRCRRG